MPTCEKLRKPVTSRRPLNNFRNHFNHRRHHISVSYRVSQWVLQRRSPTLEAGCCAGLYRKIGYYFFVEKKPQPFVFSMC